MTMSLPKVSVVMAVYNGEKYLRKAVESILDQSLVGFEFIIINDASTDTTREILNSFYDPRIMILENEKNLGLARSLNIGIAQARGKYIARQDADDISHPERLDRQVIFLDQHPNVGVVGSAAHWIDAEGSSQNKIWPSGADNAEIQQLLLQICPLIHGSTVYRRQCFEEVGGYDPIMQTAQDHDFWLRISEIWDLVCLPNVLYQYRWHAHMASEIRRDAQFDNSRKAVVRAIQRRLSFASIVLGLKGRDIPLRLRGMHRRQLAERYVCWSAGVREISKLVALQFILIAFLACPTSDAGREYLVGVARRKTHLLMSIIGARIIPYRQN